MRNLIFSLCSLSFLLLSSCSSMRVMSDYEKNTDFSQYRTYTVVKPDKDLPSGLSTLNQQRIENAIKMSFARKDFQYTDQQADIAISYFVTINTEQAYDTYSTYYGRRRNGLILTDVNIREYKEGILVIDLIDTKTQQVVWHGAATDTVSETMKNLEQKIKAAVASISEQYVLQSSIASK